MASHCDVSPVLEDHQAMSKDHPICPNSAEHVDGPENCGPHNYLAWHEWAEQKTKTHDQLQCPYCDLWAIWLPKLVYNKDKES
jgi:hypothetical protein